MHTRIAKKATLVGLVAVAALFAAVPSGLEGPNQSTTVTVADDMPWGSTASGNGDMPWG